MIPVRQTKLYQADGIGNGDCFAACLASLLELPLWMVPPFDQMFGRVGWEKRCNEWLRRFQKAELVRESGHYWARLPEFYMGNGQSPRGVYHSTIYSKGQLVHDPHFSDAGITDVEWTWHMKPV